MAGTSTRALEVLRRTGTSHEVHAYDPPARRGREHDRRPHFGSEAVTALGVPPGRVLKTLAVGVDGQLHLAVIPVDRDLDLKAVAALVGARRAAMAAPADAERATGYVIGGISPLGCRTTLPVLVDEAALEHGSVFVSAGQRGLQVRLAPDDLVRLCSAHTGRLSRDLGQG